MDRTKASRRAFIGRMAVAGPAVALAGGAGHATRAESGAAGRRAIGGSPIGAFSRAVVFDRLAYVSGVVGNKPGTLELAGDDFASQCRQAMENLKGGVEAAGAKMENVLKCTCFLTEAADFAEFNKIYVQFFTSDRPARSTVVVKELVVAGAKLEIDCVAGLP